MEPVCIENARGDHVQVNLTTGDLWFRGSLTRTLRPRATQVLELLAHRPGHLISKEEFLSAIWPGERVVDGVLRNAILEVRKALSILDSKAIVSVPRKGYRLTLAVSTNGKGTRRTSRKLWSHVQFALIIAPALTIAACVGGFNRGPDCSSRLVTPANSAAPVPVHSRSNKEIEAQHLSTSERVKIDRSIAFNNGSSTLETGAEIHAHQ